MKINHRSKMAPRVIQNPIQIEYWDLFQERKRGPRNKK
jgi:hypothetical protein